MPLNSKVFAMSSTNIGVRVEFVCDDEKLHEYVLIHRFTGYNGVEASLVILERRMFRLS